MDSLRTPFFVVALVLIALVVMVEVGAGFLPAGNSDVEQMVDQSLSGEEDIDRDEVIEKLSNSKGDKPPGLGISYLAFLDGLFLYLLSLIGLSLVIPERIHARIQGVVTLILSLVALIILIFLIIAAFVKLMIMVSLFLAAPFGTIAYIAIYGFFNTGGAATILSLSMLLKIGCGVCLVLAHQRFLQNKGLVVLILLTLLGNVIVSFLHGVVPGILVSITDALAAIVVGIIAAIVAILLLIGSLIAVVKAVKSGV